MSEATTRTFEENGIQYFELSTEDWRCPNCGAGDYDDPIYLDDPNPRPGVCEKDLDNSSDTVLVCERCDTSTPIGEVYRFVTTTERCSCCQGTGRVDV